MAINRVDFIVPVYNERENFAAFHACISRMVHNDWNILMVYDFDEDTTLEAARPLAASDPRIRLIKNSGRGVLAALSSGFKAARAEAMLVAMADDPESVISRFDDMVDAFYAQNASIVVASRYMDGGEHRGGPFIKGLLTYFASVTLRFLIGLPIHDATYNTRLYRKSFVDQTRIESVKGFEVALELTLKAYFAGGKLIEIPVAWHERQIGTSRFRLMKWLPAYLRWYLYGIRVYWGSFVWKKSAKAASTV
jgi:glycosyltransferase involved in cell wall biosynthesis